MVTELLRVRVGLRRHLAAKATVAGLIEELARLRLRLDGPMQRTMESYFAGQRMRIVARLAQGAGVDDVIDQAVEETRLRAELDPQYDLGLRYVQNAVQTALHVRYSFREHELQHYLQTCGERIVAIGQTTRAAVQDALTAGADLGESIPHLAARLRGLPAFDRARALVVARTELGTSQNEAAFTNYAKSGVVSGVTVLDGDDDDVCAAANGTVLTLEEFRRYPRLGHPNCIAGGSMVVAPNLTAAFFRWFDGEVVIIRTAEDDFLTVTPNHAVLTPDGWVAAGTLREGSDILRCPAVERVARWLDPNHDHRPTRVEQVADTLGPASGGTTTAMPVAPEAFHGDGPGSDIYVVRTNGRAQCGGEANIRQCLGQQSVIVADAERPPFAGGGTLDQLMLRNGAPAHGRMRGSGAGLALFGAESGSADTARLGPRTQRVAMSAKPMPQTRGIDAATGADFIRCFPAW